MEGSNTMGRPRHRRLAKPGLPRDDPRLPIQRHRPRHATSREIRARSPGELPKRMLAETSRAPDRPRGHARLPAVRGVVEDHVGAVVHRTDDVADGPCRAAAPAPLDVCTRVSRTIPRVTLWGWRSGGRAGVRTGDRRAAGGQCAAYDFWRATAAPPPRCRGKLPTARSHASPSLRRHAPSCASCAETTRRGSRDLLSSLL